MVDTIFVWFTSEYGITLKTRAGARTSPVLLRKKGEIFSTVTVEEGSVIGEDYGAAAVVRSLLLLRTSTRSYYSA